MQRFWRVAALVLTLFWCCVIWRFSLSPASESAELSGETLSILNQLFQRLGWSVEFTAKMIRKAAHFAEFFVLGTLAALTLRLYRFPHLLPFVAPFVFCVASVDELLQFTSPGRAPAFSDVLLDTAGGLCGWLGFLVLLRLIALVAERKAKSAKKI